MPRTLTFFAALLLLTSLHSSQASRTSAQEWAEKMFGETRCDFGTVAKGTRAEYRFELENLYEEDVHIAGVRTSCNCVTVEVTQSTLKTFEKGAIVAKLNTDAYLGQRSATVTVVIDKPYVAEVQLGVSGFIRQDVVLDPGMIRFGTVEEGSPADTVINVSHSGSSDWRIVDIRSANRHLDVGLTEKSRANGRVSYQLNMRLKPDAPAGVMSDEIRLVTNDRANQLISIAVEANVTPSLTVSPRLLSFGTLSVDDAATKKVVLRAKEAFMVEDVLCKDSRFGATSDGESAALQIVPVTLTGDGRVGRIDEVIQIQTSAGSISVQVQAEFVE